MPKERRRIGGFVFAPVLGWIVVSWFVGMMVADGARNPRMKHVNGRRGVLCRPWCYMSGTFHDGVVRPMAPWPFRRGKFFECAREGEKDSCTGETYKNGQWTKEEP